MRNIYLFLVLTTAMIFIFRIDLAAQQVKTSVNIKPVVVVSKNGKYTVCVNGSLNEKELKNSAASLAKSSNRSINKAKASNENEKSAVRSLKFGGTESLGKQIKYGPWRMLNDFKLPAYNFDEFYSYGSKDTKEPRSGSGNVKQITRLNPDQVSILKLSQNAQLTVLIGQHYSVQVEYFDFNKNAYSAMQKITTITSLPVIVVIKNGIYHILVEGFSGLRDANLFIIQLAKIGYQGNVVKINTPEKVIN
jgi:hypothetical protein